MDREYRLLEFFETLDRCQVNAMNRHRGIAISESAHLKERFIGLWKSPGIDCYPLLNIPEDSFSGGAIMTTDDLSAVSKYEVIATVRCYWNQHVGSWPALAHSRRSD
jgi:hypothetical protein